MNKAEFQAAYNLAVSGVELTADDSLLHGCALPDFQPVTCPIEACARFIRWQCCCIFGGVDADAVNEMRNIFRRKVTLVGV